MTAHPSQPSGVDPAREFLEENIGTRVIVWADAADVAYDRLRGGYLPEGKDAYVGWVEEVHDWGVVCGGYSFRWATRWNLIDWAARADAFPALSIGPPRAGWERP